MLDMTHHKTLDFFFFFSKFSFSPFPGTPRRGLPFSPGNMAGVNISTRYHGLKFWKLEMLHSRNLFF